jgi:hypothetical protein
VMADKRQVHQKLLEKKQHKEEDKEESVIDMDEDSESVTKGTKRLREAEGMYVCVLIFMYIQKKHHNLSQGRSRRIIKMKPIS